MPDWIIGLYPWIKALHIMAVISWMAGLFYLPRLFVYHAEQATMGDQLDGTFRVMEDKPGGAARPAAAEEPSEPPRDVPENPPGL